MSEVASLDPHTIAVVQSTIPLLVETGPALTAHFYQRMFSHHPELRDVFNMSNQRNGKQAAALFNAVAAYATNLKSLDALGPLVEKIAQKHASFQVEPEQYNIVGANLLATIDELLSPGQEVLDAWAKAYAVLAAIFIGREAQIYSGNAIKSGGWAGTRQFRIASKVSRSRSISSFLFEPVDEKPVAAYLPGQYLGVWLKPAGFENLEIRQYSLTTKANGKSYRIAVKRESGGAVSTWLHDEAGVGDVVDLVVPVGDFTLAAEPAIPVALISAGVGQTPLLAMLDALAAEAHPVRVSWLHAARNGSEHAFSDVAEELGAKLPIFDSHVWYSQPTKEDKKRAHSYTDGHLSLLQSPFGFAPETQFYLCGPVSFMQDISRQLVALNVSTNRIHYEVFGPDRVL